MRNQSSFSRPRRGGNSSLDSFDFQPAASTGVIPEPSTFALAALALLGLGLARWRKRAHTRYARRERPLLHQLFVVGILALSTGAAVSPAHAVSLYAVTGAGGAPSTLYQLNPATGQVVQTIGATGLDHITGLAFHPTTGVLYAHRNRPDGNESGGFNKGELYTLDLSNATPIFIGETGLQSSDMTFHPDGTLYAWAESDDSGDFGSNDNLATIDVVTGAATIIQSNQSTGGTGLAANSDGTLYLKPNTLLFTVDPLTGNTSLAGFGGLDTDGFAHNVLAIDDVDVPYTVERRSGSSFLQTFDIDTGVVSELGDIGVPAISAIAFQTEITEAELAIPEPSTLALAGWALLGLGRLRHCRSKRDSRRRETPIVTLRTQCRILRRLVCAVVLILVPSASHAALFTLDWYGTGTAQPVSGFPGVTVDVSIDTPEGSFPPTGQHLVVDWSAFISPDFVFSGDTYQWESSEELIVQQGGGAGGGDVTLTAVFSSPIPANRLVLLFNDLRFGSGNVAITGSAGTADFVAAPVIPDDSPYNSKPPLTYDSVSGDISRTSIIEENHNFLFLVGSSSDTLTSLSFFVTDPVGGDFTNFGFALAEPVEVNAIPEPSTLALAGLALLGLGLARRRANGHKRRGVPSVVLLPIAVGVLFPSTGANAATVFVYDWSTANASALGVLLDDDDTDSSPTNDNWISDVHRRHDDRFHTACHHQYDSGALLPHPLAGLALLGFGRLRQRRSGRRPCGTSDG